MNDRTTARQATASSREQIAAARAALHAAEKAAKDLGDENRRLHRSQGLAWLIAAVSTTALFTLLLVL